MKDLEDEVIGDNSPIKLPLKYSYRLASLPGSVLRPIIIIMVYSAASGLPHDAASICLVLDISLSVSILWQLLCR